MDCTDFLSEDAQSAEVTKLTQWRIESVRSQGSLVRKTVGFEHCPWPLDGCQFHLTLSSENYQG